MKLLSKCRGWMGMFGVSRNRFCRDIGGRISNSPDDFSVLASQIQALHHQGRTAAEIAEEMGLHHPEKLEALLSCKTSHEWVSIFSEISEEDAKAWEESLFEGSLGRDGWR